MLDERLCKLSLKDSFAHQERTRPEQDVDGNSQVLVESLNAVLARAKAQ